MEFPAGGDPGDSVWSQMHSQYSSSRPPPCQREVQAIYENGFPVRNSTEIMTISVWRSLYNSCVQMTRSLFNYFSDCHGILCSCEQRESVSNDNSLNRTQAAKSTICTSRETHPVETVDRFAGATAPPRPDMERSVNSNSDSPPYMPSSTRCISGNSQFGADLIQSMGFYSTTDGQPVYDPNNQTGRMGSYSSQRLKIIRDLPV